MFNELRTHLFKEEPIPELQGNTYYAYLDSLEQIDKVMHLRFDCILAIDVDQTENLQEGILQFPSRVIEIKGPYDEISALFKREFLYDLESSWMLITTAFTESEIRAEEVFNFIMIPNNNNNYTLQNVVLNRNLSNNQKRKITALKRATHISITSSQQSKASVQGFFSNFDSARFDHVNIFNVGQGNCTALVDSDNYPLMYFDVGGGFGANAFTYPAAFKLCFTQKPLIVLSHWDQDHIQTALFDSRLLDLNWLTPNQPLSNTTYRLANALNSKGNLSYWNLGRSFLFAGHKIVKCKGNPNNKNNSGLALFVNYGNDNFVLLPGDAGFHKIPAVKKNTLIGLVASHHGSKGSIRGMPTASSPGMLSYSYGGNNTFNHANPTARMSYYNQGWRHVAETVNGHIVMKVYPGTLNAPCNNANCSLNAQQSY